MINFVELSKVAKINPTQEKLAAESLADELTFLPMARVSEGGNVDISEQRPYGKVLKGYTQFRLNDVLFAKITPCMENGKAGVVPMSATDFGYGSTEFHVIRPNNGIDSRYLFHQVWNQSFRNQAARNMTGSAGQKRVPKSFLESHKIPLPMKNGKPDLLEQQRIAGILDQADAIRRKRQQALQLTDDFLRATFLDLFGDPVTNPKGWETVKFTEVGHFISGGTPSKQRDDFWDGNIPWVSPKDMKRPYLSDSIDHVSKQAFEETNLKIIEPNHVLIVVRGMILAHSFPTAINKVSVSINQDMKAIMPRNDIKSEYLKACFDVMKIKLLAHVSTAAHGTKRVDFAEMEKVTIPVPPAELQELFVGTLLQIKEMSLKHADQLKASNNLLASLQQRAFKGEL